MKYLKLFKDHDNDYVPYINSDNCILPNLSYCKNQNETHLNKFDYSKCYLTFTARESGTISFNIWKSMGTNMITSISYSTDNGETWTTTQNQDNKEEHLAINVNVNAGDEILWKGVATQTGYNDEDDYGDYVGSFFSSDCEFDAKGNVMSLLYGDNFKNQTTIEEDGTFCCLFYDYDEEKTCSIVNTKDLVLPATTLTKNCYNSMFHGCTSLTTAPELPATILASFCYYGMFSSCTSLTKAPELSTTTLANGCYSRMFSGCTLTTAPELPATTLFDYCYEYMFFDCTSLTTPPELPATTLALCCYSNMFLDCTSLTTAPELPATILAYYCYAYMFAGCTSLTTPPELPATTLANYCYKYMFSGCTSLSTVPELPATTLIIDCYGSMFSGCTSLTTAPELPATTLADYCYFSMFSGCTSLTSAPELPATTLAYNCYNGMFDGCTSLNYIKAMFTTTPGSSYTQYWVSSVASSGTFVKNSAATWNLMGVNGVPNGWTVQTANVYD